jgi:hypothetical protein
MSPRRQADPELDHLIDEITIDCYDEDEALTGFENAFDEQTAMFPITGTVVGEPVEVLRVAITNHRRELIATCQRAGHQYDIALLDIDTPTQPPITDLIAAYRRWQA